jgi:uracil-DNA glycosylase family 4
MRMADLNTRISSCTACPRLVAWCRKVAVEKRKSYADDDYWGRPVPNFGDPDGDILIVGLAPAAHGANRTGRMFTGDRSGDWLFRALHRAGLASQAEATHAGDGLELSRVLITAVCHCAPPDNKPTRDEIKTCAGFLNETVSMRSWSTVICLGSLAWAETMKFYGVSPRPKFGYGSQHQIEDGPLIIGSYHPSQQNTFTGRLTEQMLDDVIELAASRPH